MGEPADSNSDAGESDSSYTYEQLVSDVSALAEELGDSPTTRDAQDDDRFPSLNTMYGVIREDWAAVLDDADLEPNPQQVDSYDERERGAMEADLRRVNREVASDHLTMRQYDDLGRYATSTVKLHFGSWAEACKSAGISAGRKHGEACEGPNGDRLDSWHEREVAEFLSDRGLAYETHPPVGDTGYEADFYLSEWEFWIEVDGYVAGERPNRESFDEKLEYFEANDLDHVVVDSSDEVAVALRNHDAIPGT